MAGRILTCVSCTLYFSVLITLIAVGLTSIVIGFISLGLYIPTLINYNAYNRSICYIVDHEYDTCQNQPNPCFSVMWFVEYTISNSTFSYGAFSTITQTYGKSIDALEKLKVYKDQTNHTCYYQNTYTTNVQWDKPKSPRLYLIMMIVGFSLTGIYVLVITSITIYRCRKQ